MVCPTCTQVFITPLRKVTSTAVVDGLLGFCGNPQDRFFLQALGMAIGNKHWADDFKEMQKHPESMSGVPSKTLPLHSQLHTQPISYDKVHVYLIHTCLCFMYCVFELCVHVLVRLTKLGKEEEF